MGVIRCPKCKLINTENIRRCRRCDTPLSSDNAGVVPDPRKSAKLNREARRWALPILVIVSLLCSYGYYRHSKGVSSSGSALAEANKVIVKSPPANQELEGVKKLSRDFTAQLDRNAADSKGDGISKNQTVAYNTLMSVKDQQNKLIDPAAQKYLNEFYRLVETYYDQVVRFNSETARLAEVRKRITGEIEHVKQDSSLTSEDKISREADLRLEIIKGLEERNVIANNMDETVKSLRNLSASGSAS